MRTMIKITMRVVIMIVAKIVVDHYSIHKTYVMCWCWDDVLRRCDVQKVCMRPGFKAHVNAVTGGTPKQSSHIFGNPNLWRFPKSASHLGTPEYQARNIVCNGKGNVVFRTTHMCSARDCLS